MNPIHRTDHRGDPLTRAHRNAASAPFDPDDGESDARRHLPEGHGACAGRPFRNRVRVRRSPRGCCGRNADAASDFDGGDSARRRGINAGTKGRTKWVPAAVAVGIAVVLAAGWFGWRRFGTRSRVRGSSSCGPSVREPRCARRRILRRRYHRRSTRKAHGSPRVCRDGARQRGSVQERELEDSAADWPGTWGRVPPGRDHQVGKRARRHSPRASESRTD